LGINNVGQVVGYSAPSDSVRYATVWNGTTPIALETLGARLSYAYDINDVGQVVGSRLSTDEKQDRATLWNGTIASDLNDFLDPNVAAAGWHLAEARGINNSGSIVGRATKTTSTGTFITSHAFVLTPLVNKEQCKNGGWSSFRFENQGKCFAYLRTGQ
jgi:probable HAF family extracellular repeat protein